MRLKKSFRTKDKYFNVFEEGDKDVRVGVEPSARGGVDIEKILESTDVSRVSGEIVEVTVTSRPRYTYENKDKMPEGVAVCDWDSITLGEEVGFGLNDETRMVCEDGVIKVASHDHLVRMLEKEISMLDEMREVGGVIKIKGVVRRGETTAGLITPHMTNGTIISYVKSNNVGWEKRVEWVMEVASTVREVNLLGVSHCDIRGHNVVLSSDLRPILIDFGSSLYTGCGKRPESTVNWSPPETEVHETYDVYMIGMFLWEMMTEERPYGYTMLRDVDKSVTKPGLERVPEKVRPVIIECWRDKDKRKGMDEIIKLMKEVLNVRGDP